LNLWDFEAIDWDDEEDPDGNLVHCLRRGIDEVVVDEVLSESPVEIKMRLASAEIAIVGPDRGGTMWTLLFDWSFKRGDWLRPVTGWQAEPEEVNEWRRARGATMNDEVRASERERRDKALEQRDGVVPGSGTPLEPRRIPQMVSVRLDPELVIALRRLADERRTSVSDLLREGAEMVLMASATVSLTWQSWTVTSDATMTRANPGTAATFGDLTRETGEELAAAS
jgi:predicted transcriptional regulator